MQMSFEELSKELAEMGMRVLMTTIADGKEVAIVEKLVPDEPIRLTKDPNQKIFAKLTTVLEICKACTAFDKSRSICMIAEVQIPRLLNTKCPIDRW